MDWKVLTESASNAGAVVAILLAAWAAYESRRSANASLAASEGALLLALINEYFEPRTAEALRVLCAWRDDHGPEFAANWESAIRAHDPEAKAVEDARRHVKSFYNRAVRLFSAGLLSKGTFREIVYAAGINVYYDIVVPLERQKNPEQRDRTEGLLKREVGRYSEGAPAF